VTFFPKPELVAAVEEIGKYLYATHLGHSVQIPLLEEAFAAVPQHIRDEALAALADSRLVRVSAAGNALLLNEYGKEAYEEDCISAIAFGEQLVLSKCSTGVVHVIVQKPNLDKASGTGFCISEPVEAVVTAKHVVEGNVFERIELDHGTTISTKLTKCVLGPPGLDLALLFPDIEQWPASLKIEWRENRTRDLEPVLVLGFPKIPGHAPQLLPASAQASRNVPGYDGSRNSLILQRLTTPGYSGGPVINMRGAVVGVVREEGSLEQLEGTTVLVMATPANYLKELF
jgi:S1-C subfamily serine protease